VRYEKKLQAIGFRLQAVVKKNIRERLLTDTINGQRCCELCAVRCEKKLQAIGFRLQAVVKKNICERLLTDNH